MAYVKWKRKYCVVFIPKYRKKKLYCFVLANQTHTFGLTYALVLNCKVKLT